MNKTVKVGIVGLGVRTETLLASFVALDDVEVVAVCDLLEERIQKIVKILTSHGKPAPKTFTNYHDMLKYDEIEAIFVPTSWNSHLSIAIDCMEAGKYVAIEVGGAASVDELWRLIHAYERTGKPCMMLENCCYARNEAFIQSSARCSIRHPSLISGYPLLPTPRTFPLSSASRAFVQVVPMSKPITYIHFLHVLSQKGKINTSCLFQNIYNFQSGMSFVQLAKGLAITSLT